MIKNIFLYLFSGGFSSLISILISIYLSHNLLPDEYAYIGIFMMILFLLEPMLSFFSIGLLEINIIKLNSYKYEKYKNKFISFIFINFLIILSILFFISFILKNYKYIFYILPFVIFTDVLVKIKYLELIQLSKAFIYSKYIAFNAILKLFFTLILIGVFQLSWVGVILSILFSNFILIFLFYKNYNFKFCFFSRNELKEIFVFGLPLIIALFPGWIMNESDKYIALKFFNLEIVGIYTYAYTLGKGIRIFGQSILKTIRPKYFRLLNSNEITVYFHVKMLIIVFVSLFLLVSLFNFIIYEFKFVFLPDKYEKGLFIVFIISYSFVFWNLYQLCVLVLEFEKKNYERMKIAYVGAFVNIFFSIYLIRYFGYYSLAIGTCLGFFSLFVLTFIFSIYIIKRK